MATIYYPDGTSAEHTPADGVTFTLPELQCIVGGYIDLCRTHAGAPMFINEEGRLKGLPYNEQATAAYKYGAHPGHHIVGVAVICSELEAGD